MSEHLQEVHVSMILGVALQNRLTGLAEDVIVFTF
jgi:hypothetical protein